MVSTRSKSLSASSPASTASTATTATLKCDFLKYGPIDPDKITRHKPKKKKVRLLDVRWSVGQKERLLSSLMKHGCYDYKAIAKEFPEFTKTTVKNMVLKMIQKSKSTSTNNDSNKITGWKNTKLYSNQNMMITKALKFMSLFEKHPSPDECAGCDFSALYNFLSNATLGRHVLHSSTMTHETLWNVIQRISNDDLIYDEKKCRQYIRHDVNKLLRKKQKKKK